MRYVTPGIPAGAQASAFMPHMNRLAGSGAQSYKQAVTGQPGTIAIPAPTSDIPHGGQAGQAMMGTARSTDAPDVWYPQQYYQRSLTERPGAGQPIRVYSDNLMPVPAVDGRSTRGLARLAKPILQRGQTQIAMPRVIPSWGPGG